MTKGVGQVAGTGRRPVALWDAETKSCDEVPDPFERLRVIVPSWRRRR